MDDVDEERATTPLLKASNAVIEPCPRPRLDSEYYTANQSSIYANEFDEDVVDSNFDDTLIRQRSWELNYREAAIYLQEGQDNEKFSVHPQRWADLPAYIIVHSVWFYVFSFVASLLLLALAIVEVPAVPIPGFHISVVLHASLELLALFVILVELIMKLNWLGCRAYVQHIRTTAKTVVLLVMIAEAIIVIVRGQNHTRVTRALRPVFLLDSPYCSGVRRFFRQLIQSLPPIIDMLVLLLFFLLLFAMLGFYLFSGVPNDTYFQDMGQSFISMFILLTTANFPDVMMPAYKHSRWSVVFFVVFICIEIFLFVNLFLAVVYSAFMKIEKDKVKKLLLHRREACSAAFKLLVSGEHPNEMAVRHFQGCMKHFRPRLSRRDVYLSFKLLNSEKTGRLSEEEFMAVYDITSMNWKPRRLHEMWAAKFRSPFNSVFRCLNRIVSSRWFEYFITVVIVVNFLWIIADTIRISVLKTSSSPLDWASAERPFLWCSVVFVAVYVIEAALKILGLGPYQYFYSGWNVFDCIVTAFSFIGLLLEIVSNSFYYVIILRPLRVLSMAVAMLLLFYSFAIIGMEMFASSTSKLKDCCRNTSVEQYYMTDEVAGLDGYYYLNTFENILISGVTLFELTVVNNWWIVMEGFANVMSGWSRIYFIVFYLVVMVFMNVVIAFILDAFIFRIQYRQQMNGHDIDDDAVRKADVKLSMDEMRMCDNSQDALSGTYIEQQSNELVIANDTDGLLSEATCLYVWYRGIKRLSKNDLSRKMYAAEVEEWIAEHNEKCRRRANSPTSRDRSSLSPAQPCVVTEIRPV